MPALVAIEVAAPECATILESDVEPDVERGGGPAIAPVCQSPQLAAMLEACNAALQPGACVAGAPTLGAEQVARVNVTSETSVTIEVRTLRDGSAPPIVRVLTFDAGDEATEKWRTVGFTTALLAEGGRQRPAAPPAPPVPEALSYVGLMTARLVGASGFGARSPKAGGHLHLAARPWKAPWLLGVSAEYTTSAWAKPGVSGEATWGELGLAVSFLVPVADDLELLTHVTGLAQRLALTAEKKAESAAASLWQPGMRVGVDVAWPLYARWYGVIGAQATWVTAPVELRVEDREVATVPVLGGGVSIGIQYRF